MPDTPGPTPSLQDVQARLQEVARMLRSSPSLDAESQRVLAELMDELSAALREENAPPATVAHLAESAAHLAESLHYQRDRGLLGRARDRLEQAMINAEDSAPLVVGLTRRFLDALANVGI